MLEELNKLGEQGWEAVAMTTEGYILMKRPKLETSKKNR